MGDVGVVGQVLFIYLKGVYHSYATRRIVHEVISSTKHRTRFFLSSTKLVGCRRNRPTSTQVHTRTTQEKCRVARLSHPIQCSSFFSFSLVIKVSSHGVSGLGTVTPKLRRRRGIIHVASCYQVGIISRIPSPCCKNSSNFRAIVSVLRSTYTNLLTSVRARGST